MRILALIGAALMAAAIGALVAVYKRDRPQPAPTETVISRATLNSTLQVPLPADFCALDASKRRTTPSSARSPA